MFKHLRFVRTVVLMVGTLGLTTGLAIPTAPVQAQDPATLLYVQDMGVGYYNVGGPRRQAVAFVRIVDGNGLPVNGALVVGNWSGCFKQNNDSALTQTYFYTDPYTGTVTQVDGEAQVWADKTYSCWGQKQPCYFIFTITGVVKNGMTYVPVNGWRTSWASTPCN